MLRFLRKYSNSAFIKVLYGVLAVLFVIWGVGAMGGQKADAIATVHGEQISRSQLDRTTAVLQRQYEQLLRGAPLPRGFNLRGQALDRLIDAALLEHEAKRLGLAVTDAEIVRAITEMPQFQEDGRFNRDLVQRTLDAVRDRGEFEEDVRRQILTERLQALVTDAVQVTDAELKQQYALDHDQVNLAYVKVAGVDLAKDVAPTDDELEKYLSGHPERYKVPTKVRARYVAYRAADFGAAVEPSDADVADYYEAHKDDRFATAEQVHVRQILVRAAGDSDDAKVEQARKKADDLRAKAAAGEDFAALAKKSSEDPATAKNGGDLGLVTRQALAPDLANVAFALDAGAVSDVVRGPNGFYVLKVEQKQAAGTKRLDDVRAEIVTTLKNERGLDLARKQVETDRRAIVRGQSLAEAAAGRQIEETPPFGENDLVPGVGRLREFNEAAFALGEGQPSNPIEAEEVIYLLTPFGRVDAHTPPLAEVHDRVLADVKRERGEALAKEKADTLRTRAKQVGLERAAADAGLKAEETGTFDRKSGPKGLYNPDLRTDAFALTKDDPIGPKTYPSGGDVLVVALKDRQPADMSGFDAAKDGLREQVLQQKRSTAMTKYVDFLKQRAQAEGALQVNADAFGRG